MKDLSPEAREALSRVREALKAVQRRVEPELAEFDAEMKMLQAAKHLLVAFERRDVLAMDEAKRVLDIGKPSESRKLSQLASGCARAAFALSRGLYDESRMLADAILTALAKGQASSSRALGVSLELTIDVPESMSREEAAAIVAQVVSAASMAHVQRGGSGLKLERTNADQPAVAEVFA